MKRTLFLLLLTLSFISCDNESQTTYDPDDYIMGEYYAKSCSTESQSFAATGVCEVSIREGTVYVSGHADTPQYNSFNFNTYLSGDKLYDVKRKTLIGKLESIKNGIYIHHYSVDEQRTYEFQR